MGHMLLRCSACNEDKDEDEFSRKGEKRQRYCKSCQKSYKSKHYQDHKKYYRSLVVERRRRNYAYLAERKNIACADCKNSYIPYAMDFDHTSDDKDYNVSMLAHRGVSLARLQEEIDKCDVVCATCHRIRTFNRLHVGR